MDAAETFGQNSSGIILACIKMVSDHETSVAEAAKSLVIQVFCTWFCFLFSTMEAHSFANLKGVWSLYLKVRNGKL